MSSETVTHDPSVRDYADTSPAKLGRTRTGPACQKVTEASSFGSNPATTLREGSS